MSEYSVLYIPVVVFQCGHAHHLVLQVLIAPGPALSLHKYIYTYMYITHTMYTHICSSHIQSSQAAGCLLGYFQTTYFPMEPPTSMHNNVELHSNACTLFEQHSIAPPASLMNQPSFSIYAATSIYTCII